MSWSDWITPPPDNYPIADESYLPGVLGSVSTDAYPGRPDFSSVIEGYREQIAAGEAALFENYAVMADARVQAAYNEGSDSTAISAAAGQGYVLLHGSAFADRFDWSPPELDALTPGVDYDVRPDRSPGDLDAYVDYESAHTDFLGWLDWTAHLTYTVVDAENSDVGAGPAEPPWGGEGFGLRLAYTDLLSPLPAGEAQPWLAYGHGSELGMLTVPMDLNFGAYAGTTPAIDRLVPLSALPVADCTLLMQPSFLDGLALPAPSPATNAMAALFTVALVAPASPEVVYQRPRWRYWVPAGATPMRLFQRNDGLGPSGHARIVTSSVPNGASSTQRQRPPRIGTANVIDPGPNSGRPSL